MGLFLSLFCFFSNAKRLMLGETMLAFLIAIFLDSLKKKVEVDLSLFFLIEIFVLMFFSTVLKFNPHSFGILFSSTIIELILTSEAFKILKSTNKKKLLRE